MLHIVNDTLEFMHNHHMSFQKFCLIKLVRVVINTKSYTFNITIITWNYWKIWRNFERKIVSHFVSNILTISLYMILIDLNCIITTLTYKFYGMQKMNCQRSMNNLHILNCWHISETSAVSHYRVIFKPYRKRRRYKWYLDIYF